jgi:HK97 family phage portal protein
MKLRLRENIAMRLLGKSSRLFRHLFQAHEISGGIASDADSESYVRTYGAASWVYVCVRKIAQTCASVPIKFYKDISDTGTQEQTEGEVVELFQKVNPYIAFANLMESTMTYLLLHGDAYWSIETNGTKEIYSLRPDRMRIIPDAKEYVGGYIYTVNNVKIPYEPEEIIHFKLFNPQDDYYGLSAISAAKSILTLDFYALDSNKNLFKNAARPGGVVEVPESLDPITFKRLKQEWELGYKGSDKWHKLLLLEGGGKWRETTIPPKDMEFINMRKMTREEICSIFGVPPAVVGLFEYASYANADAQYKIFWQDTIIPYLTGISNMLNENFIKRFDDELYCQFDLSNVPALRENEREKMEISTGLVARNIITVNEARQRYYSLEPVEWGDQPQQIGALPFGLSLNLNQPNSIPIESKKTFLLNHKDFTPEEEEHWKAFDRQLGRQEKTFQKIIKEFLDGQKERVVEAFKESNIVKMFHVKLNQDEIDQIFDMLKENKILGDITRAEFKRIIEETARRTQGQIGVDFEFSPLTPEIETWLEKKILRMVKSVNETSRKQIANIITEALASPEGYSTGEITNQIADSLDQVSDYRSERIARTETIGTHNKAIIETYIQSDVVEGKQWIATLDDRVRDSHKEAHGQIVGLREPFRVGDDLLMFPGDVGGDASNTVNCRCTIKAILKE